MNLKRPFDINVAVGKIREAIQPFPKAAMFALAEEGYTSLFEQLIACIISVRTYDEVSLPVARQLFVHARTPADVSKLPVARLQQIIQASTYAERKAEQIHAIAQHIMQVYKGELPCDVDILLAFNGVGPKCAHLALGIACDMPYISVDVHVHRITNRWGYVQTRTPEKTAIALEQKLPQTYWVEINQLLVPFGKHICTGQHPHCSTCPLVDMCPRVDV